MGIAKNFTDEMAKHKWLVYFVTLWGAMLFLWTVYGMIEYGFQMTDALDVLDLLFHLSELFAGALLVLFGLKLMAPSVLKTLKNERLLVYFLILWAASFFFMGLYDLVDFGPWILQYAQDAIAFLSGLAALFAGIALWLFSWKLLTEKTE